MPSQFAVYAALFLYTDKLLFNAVLKIFIYGLGKVSFYIMFYHSALY